MPSLFARARRRMKPTLAMLILVLVVAGCSGQSPAALSANATPTSLQATAVECTHKRDLPCAESAWTAYIKLRPMDTMAIANLGFVFNMQDKDEAAIEQMEKAIGMGEGTYDLFAYYADSLAKVGRVDEAIDWSYKTLKLVSTLVDVRGKLSKLLVSKKRSYEALILLTEFDQGLEELGHDPYFEGQRIAIESAAKGSAGERSGEAQHLRLVKLDGVFHAPVIVGESGAHAFVIDTGASSVVVNDDFLSRAKVKYSVLRPHASARLADNRVMDAKEIVIEHMNVGPFGLDDVKAMECHACQLLLGGNALSKFDMNATQVQGVDVLTLSPRPAQP